MSFRELRNFTEMLRTLEFPRLVSIDNFRQPNFPLVAEILIWIVHRIDATATIPTDIEEETDRVLFVKAIAQFMATKLHLRLNTKRLYEADGHAVKELIKATALLYNALKSQSADESQESRDGGPPVTLSDFNLSSKLGELKQTRALASEITSRGAALHQLLGQELDLREERSKALAKGLDIAEVEQGVRKAIESVKQQINTTMERMDNLSSDEANLLEKLEKRKQELERNQKRLRSLQSVRPAFMDEYEKLEVDLSKTYEMYIEKFRNLSYLEQQLEQHNRAEQDKLQETEQQLKRMQARLREEEMRMMRGGDDVGLGGALGDSDIGSGDTDSDADLETEPRGVAMYGDMRGGRGSDDGSDLSDSFGDLGDDDDDDDLDDDDDDDDLGGIGDDDFDDDLSDDAF